MHLSIQMISEISWTRMCLWRKERVESRSSMCPPSDEMMVIMFLFPRSR